MGAGTGVAGDSARDRSRAVPELDAVHSGPLAVQADVPNRNALGSEGRARTDDHPVGGRVLLEHVERLAGVGDPQAASLADREAVLAVVMSDDVAALIDDLTR